MATLPRRRLASQLGLLKAVEASCNCKGRTWESAAHWGRSMPRPVGSDASADAAPPGALWGQARSVFRSAILTRQHAEALREGGARSEPCHEPAGSSSMQLAAGSGEEAGGPPPAGTSRPGSASPLEQLCLLPRFTCTVLPVAFLWFHMYCPLLCTPLPPLVLSCLVDSPVLTSSVLPGAFPGAFPWLRLASEQSGL